MTGNMVFLGFGIANIKGPWLPVVLPLSTFAVGVLCRLSDRDPAQSGFSQDWFGAPSQEGCSSFTHAATPLNCHL
jgi:hypothetical protein